MGVPAPAEGRPPEVSLSDSHSIDTLEGGKDVHAPDLRSHEVPAPVEGNDEHDFGPWLQAVAGPATIEQQGITGAEESFTSAKLVRFILQGASAATPGYVAAEYLSDARAHLT